MSTHPYRPSNGTEGIGFMARWCDQCCRDEAFRNDEGDSCPIAAAAMVFMLGHPEYPTEWIADDLLGPCCTAFEPCSMGMVPDVRQLVIAI